MKNLAHPSVPKCSHCGPVPFLSLLILLLSNVSFGQTDPQWYVQHTKGRSGFSLVYEHNNSIDSIFTIREIRHPNRACNKLAKNELFIIYTDGSHFNSREKANSDSIYLIDFFYPNTPNSTVLSSPNHYFKTIGNKSVRYLYMTNKYEGDEPPKTIRVKKESPPQGETIYRPGTTITNSPLSATHDVVKNKDITLIVNYAEILNQFGKDSKFTYYLQYDKVKSRVQGRGDSSHQEFFKLEPVFKESPTPKPVLPSSSVTPIINKAKVELKKGSDYIYINLHPTSHLTTFYPNTPDGAVRYDALFEIYRETRINENVTEYELMSVHPEAIRLSHDPNFMAVESICMKDDEIYICYHVEFTNTSFNAADHIQVEMDFPDDFVDKCISVSSWNLGGIETGGRIELCNGKIKAIFPPHRSLVQCQSSQYRDLCTGSLDFCIKVNTQEDVRNLEYNVQPIVNVYFQGAPYPLTHFIDPFIQDSTKEEFIAMRPPPVTDCETDCYAICLPCNICIRDLLPVALISFSVLAFFWLLYRRLRSKAAK